MKYRFYLVILTALIATFVRSTHSDIEGKSSHLMPPEAQAALPQTTLGGQFPLFVSNESNASIVKVDSEGNQSVFTSGGYFGFGGAFGKPRDLAFDNTGNLFVVLHNDDAGRIIKVDSEGNQGVFISGESQASGLAFDSNGNLFVSYLHGTIIKVDSEGNQSVFTSGGHLSNPRGLAFDSSGNLFVANFWFGGITKVDSEGNQSVFASVTGQGLAFDSSGNLFAANPLGDSIVKVDSGGNQSVFTSGGYLSTPRDLAFDSSGNLFVVDEGSSAIIKVDSGGNQSVFASGGHLGSSWGLAFATVIPNAPPIAEANGPYDTLTEGTSGQLDGSGSHDPDPGDTLTYEWDLDYDGVTFGVDTTGVQPQVTFPDNFPARTVALRVTDPDGLTDLDTAILEVANVEPTADFANTTGTIIEGESATLAFSNQFDPSSVDTAAGFWYSYDCTNDGTFELNDGFSQSSYNCSYLQSGIFTAKGVIKDKDNGSTPYTAEVTVITPANATQDLIDTVEEINQQQDIPNGLDDKLNAALNALDDLNANNDGAAINSLQAFINAVEAQREKSLDNDQADLLIAMAQRIIDSIS